ncbi:Oidioi.mRNA.OKI2018_I69.PAR.g11741.t1.cds [Oikopleura dioica]|uniref:Oidioi.mRNA.OKI2018_I69.PAR.g11741.t1.cds n=1 Tax=Oikopleura dioica TaxID=34765 RepID=A0ABN7RX91_OIKDI|nr:Oidioi.mRNA.OKI2018_I69.PAR.g11741.t1.cds [Oikopleura dioica]
MYDFFLQHQNGLNEFVIVSELCEKTLLQEQFSMKSFIRYFSEVNAAIKAMGEQGLCHRDIKPQNILLKRNENGVLSVRVADFGLSGFSGGTPLYNPPESSTESIPFASDIYSLGITMLFTLFESDLAFKMYLMPGDRPNLKKKLGVFNSIAFISQMIADDYKLRPTADEIDRFLCTTRLWKITFSDSTRITEDDLGISDEINALTSTSIGSDIQRRAAKFQTDAFSTLLFQETAPRTTDFDSKFFQGITELSKMISRTIHDQGDSYKCWAFATASMIRSSLREAISNSGRIDKLAKEELYESVKSIDHKLLRSELMMNVIPTKVSANSDEIQSAMLHHVMRRLTEPTLLQREGIFMLGCLKAILKKLEPFEVKLEIFAHPTDYDRFPKNLSDNGVVGDFINALEHKKVLVCPVRMGSSSIKHAMCLYGFNEESEFLFKNTSNETKTIAIPLTKCEPRIGYHICFQESVDSTVAE